MENKDQKILLGRRIRALRSARGWTQMELGDRADVSYKFLGEIERGVKNPSFDILLRLACALGAPLPELFKFEHEATEIKEVVAEIQKIIKIAPDQDLRRILMILKALYPYSF